MFPGGKGGRYVGLTTLPPSCADYLEIWEPQTPGTLKACPGLEGYLFYISCSVLTVVEDDQFGHLKSLPVRSQLAVCSTMLGHATYSFIQKKT